MNVKVNGYRVGTMAFCLGTIIWGVRGYLANGTVDSTVIAYSVGCIYFFDDAFKPLARLRAGKWSLQHKLGLNSYRTGSIAYTLGTIVWAVQSWRATHTIDIAAALYLLGCLYFLADAFKKKGVGGATSWLSRKIPVTSHQAGTLAFFGGTCAWGFTEGISIPVAAYGLGCLFYLKDAFAMRVTSLAAPALIDEHARVGGESSSSIRALLFDLDGTLVDSEGQTDAAIRSVLEHHYGHANTAHLPPEETRGRTWNDIARVLIDRYALSHAPEGSHVATETKLAKKLADELATEWATSIDAMVPIPGAPQALRAASEHFAIAVVSSSPHDLVERVLRHLGVADIVKVIVGGDDVVKPKPEPECFVRAAELLSVKPEECVVFEDSSAGLEAARRAGMASVLILVRCDEPDRCRTLATGSILHYEAMPPSIWSILQAEGPRALLDLS